MLNIIKLKKKNNKLNIVESEGNKIGPTRYFPPATQEWKDSIYTFNKNTSKIIPVANNYVFNLIKSYFNMFSWKVERRIKLRRVRTWKRRLSGRKIWISKPELKYSNNKIIINLYIYNRQYTFLLKRLYKLKLSWGKRLKITLNKKLGNRVLKKKIIYKDRWASVLKKIKNKSVKFYSRLQWAILNKNINNKWSVLLNKKLIKLNKETWNYILDISYIHLIQKMLRYQIIYMRNKQAILLNELKFKDTYLIPIKLLIQKIYNKKIEFNLVSLKKFNHNSSILAQIVTSKIKNRRNKPLKVIKTSIRKSKVYNFNKSLLKQEQVKLKGKQNYIINNFNFYFNNNKDYLNNVLKNKLYDNNNIENKILSSTNNKVIIGIRVQASGRITRRLIAQRATCKIRYKGTLKNIDSTYRGLSSVILKGNEKSSLQYTHLSSKRRIGAFGLKGWINAY